MVAAFSPAPTTSASVSNNIVTGAGPTDVIAQNGIVIRSGANATVNKNTVSNLGYTPAGTEAAGLLLYDAGRVNVEQQDRRHRGPHRQLDGTPEATSSPNLRPHSTDRGLHAEAPVFLCIG